MGNVFLRHAFPAPRKPSSEPPTLGYLAAVLGSVIAIPVFNFFLTIVGADTWAKGIGWACTFALFDAGINAPHPFFEERRFAVYLVHRLYHLVSLMALGVLLTSLNF